MLKRILSIFYTFLYVILGFMLGIIMTSVFAAWDSIKGPGSPILSADWNALVAAVNSKLSSYTETDPTVNTLGKATLSCSSNQIAKWNGSAWACAADAGIISYTETDPKVGTHTSNYISKWNGAAFQDTSLSESGNTKLVVKGSSTDNQAFGLNVTDSTNTSKLLVRNDGNVGIGTPTPTAKLDVNGTVNVNNNIVSNVAAPVAESDAATKAYVDAASGSSGGKYRISCTSVYSNSYYMCTRIDIETGATECMNTNNGGSTWSSCGTSFSGTSNATGYDSNGILNGGYFVLTGTTYQGNLGGLTGANQKCYDELTTHPWKGKGTTILTTSNVKAFLCDNSTCNNTLPYTRYTFAAARNINAGGSTFVTDMNGSGPNDGNNWNSSNYFSSSGGWWSNRSTLSGSNWGSIPYAPNPYVCNTWTSVSSSDYGVKGETSSANDGRWKIESGGSWSGVQCSSSHKLICIVNPTL